MTTTFSLGSHSIGAGQPCLVIAEIAQAHDGSLGTAHAYIDAVARTGAHAIKFQTHIAAAESTPGEPFRVRFSTQDENRYDYWKRIEFTEAQWKELRDHAHSAGLIFLSTPFSFAAVELLERLDVVAWKIGSGEVTNVPMLERMASTGRPLLISSGMSSWEDLDRAVGIATRANAPLALLQCTTAYPCPAEKVGLNVMAQLRERYQCPVGLSDHSGTIYASLAAAALGANLVEVHVVFSRECFGPDVGASVTTDELRQLVEGVGFIDQALAHPLDKDVVAGELGELRVMFGKSVVTVKDLQVGHRLTRDDLDLRKPGNGIPAARLVELLGRRLKRAVVANSILGEADLESD